MSDLVVIGGGPAGLVAADIASAAGLSVALYDRMPTVGRKLLMAGRGGLNLTHSEPLPAFVARYGARAGWFEGLLADFGPAELRAFAQGLGVETYVGSSGRVFPREMKASPLLRAWLRRLAAQNVQIHTGHCWNDWNRDGSLSFTDSTGAEVRVVGRQVLLALGGASWPKLGSRGDWTHVLQARGIRVEPLRPSNCGLSIGWSEVFGGRFAGTPLHGAAFSFGGQRTRGEAVVTPYGLEGGAVYGLSQAIREALVRERHVDLLVDLRPDMSVDVLAQKLSRPRGGDSFSNAMRKAISLDPVSVNLLREAFGAAVDAAPRVLAARVKALPLKVRSVQPLARAISTAGGVAVEALDDMLMLRQVPGTFVAGEMIDWEAPTGGYLLQGCFATGVRAAHGIVARHRAAGA